jgi:hypothetical protein
MNEMMKYFDLKQVEAVVEEIENHTRLTIVPQ